MHILLLLYPLLGDYARAAKEDEGGEGRNDSFFEGKERIKETSLVIVANILWLNRIFANWYGFARAAPGGRSRVVPLTTSSEFAPQITRALKKAGDFSPAFDNEGFWFESNQHSRVTE